MEDNEIELLNGLENVTNLMELYIGNNFVSDMKNVTVLKSMNKLIILDISGNPLCADK